MRKKFIIFCMDDSYKSDWSLYEKNLKIDILRCFTYEETENALKEEIPFIVTTSMTHLSFDLIDMGYNIFVFWNGVQKMMFPGMESISTEKEIRKSHNILKLLRAGVFDKDFSYDIHYRAFDYLYM